MPTNMKYEIFTFLPVIIVVDKIVGSFSMNRHGCGQCAQVCA